MRCGSSYLLQTHALSCTCPHPQMPPPSLSEPSVKIEELPGGIGTRYCVPVDMSDVEAGVGLPGLGDNAAPVKAAA